MSRFLEDPESLSENDIGNETDPGTEEPVGPGTEMPGPGENEGQAGEDDQVKTPEQGVGDQQENVSDEISSRYDEIMERIDQLNMQEDPTEITSLTDSIRSLVDLMSMDQYQQGGVYTPPDILIEGYEAWDYPITVDYLISIVGYEEMVPQSASYDEHEQFLEDFQDMAWNCYLGTVFKDFYIDKVYDAGGNKVYDAQPETEPEPDPGEEEPESVADQLLSHLESIDTTLAEMQQSDLEYYQTVYDYQEEMLELQTAETATTIFICIGVFSIFMILLWSVLFRRFK